jgi:pimeloyl-ACP methyl ester carboxylesterase
MAAGARYLGLVVVLFLLGVPRAGAEDVPSNSAGQAIPRAQLEQVYRHELEGHFQPADADKVFAAHQLIEQYFAATTAAARKKLIADLEGTGLDVNLLGRLCRIRMNWPALQPGGVYYVNERFGPHTVRYFVGVPTAYDRTRPWPLVVKLPGAHAFTTTPPPSGDQEVEIYRGWAEDELKHHGDAIVLLPMLDLKELWGPTYSGMNRVIQPMLHVAGKVNVDPARVYLIGHSMSGHAAWNLALHYPTYFAAFNPLAGSASGDWQRLRLINLRNVLPVVWHDADDDVIPVARSQAIVKALRALKLDVEYDETRGLGHAPSPEVAEKEYQKLRGRTRELYPVQVWLQSNRPDSLFNRADWVQVYQPLRPGKDQRLLIKGGGQMNVYQNAFRIDASVVAPNRIELKPDNVAILRLYLNDRLVDMKKPVTVVVNKKMKFEGLVKPSVGEMLADQLYLGRGWRYYSAVVDLDLAETPTPRPSTRPATLAPAAPARPSPAPRK